MSSQRVRGFIVAGLAACLGLVLWARAGDLNPPAGPVAPTMKTLDQLSAEHAQLAAAIAAIPGGGGGVKQIIRGVVSVPSGQAEASQSLSATIDPGKSIAVLSDAVITTPYSGTQSYVSARNGACLINLTSTTITIRIDDTAPSGIRQVSYQIIEYN